MADSNRTGRTMKSGRSARARPRTPSTQTLFRLVVLDEAGGESIRKALMKLSPLLLLRDGARVKQIRTAKTVEELLDLLPAATGMADFAWQDRMRQFGADALPAISQRLVAIKKLPTGELRHMTAEKLVAALRWRGAAGAQTLLACFDSLDDYGKSLACMVLGLLGEKAAADGMWTFYRRVNANMRESHFVGPLWGLVDLGDSRAGEALADLASRRHDFYELYGLLARAGDARAVLPLLHVIELLSNDEERLDPSMALIAIAHRIGRETLIAEMARGGEGEENRAFIEEIADALLGKAADSPETYFELFYRGLNAQTLAEAVPALQGKR